MNEMIIANDDDDGDGMSLGNKRSRSDNNSNDIITKRTCHCNNDDDVNAYYNESKQSHNHWTSSFNVDVYSYFINSTSSNSNDNGGNNGYTDSNNHYHDSYSEQYQETKRDHSVPSSSSSLLRNRNYSMTKSSSSSNNKVPSSSSSSSSSVIHRPSYLSLQMFGKKWSSSSLSSDSDDYNGLTCPSSPYRDMKSSSSSSSYYNFKNILTETDDVNIIIEPFFTLNKGFIAILLLLLILLYKTLSLSSYYYYVILITTSVLYFNCSYISSSLSSLLSIHRKVDYE